MPRLDRTGPLGQGPRTGRGMGNCSSCPRFANCPNLSKEEREKLLLEEKEAVERELANLDK
jgi:hypothetical protein